MPQKEYRKLKNRKSAREQRKKRKSQISDMEVEIKELRDKNTSLTDKVKTLERQIEKADLIERMR